MNSPTEIENIRKECWRKRFYSFGTTKVFEKRARSLGTKRDVITFLGLATPVFVGAFVGAYSAESQTLKVIVLPVVGAIMIFQAVMSLWSLVARWDDNYSYAVSAVKNNTRLTSDFEELATAPEDRLLKEIERLRFEYSRQEAEDTAQKLTDKEKRFAQRSALFQYRSKCPTCCEVPKSMTPSNCDSCGNF